MRKPISRTTIEIYASVWWFSLRIASLIIRHVWRTHTFNRKFIQSVKRLKNHNSMKMNFLCKSFLRWFFELIRLVKQSIESNRIEITLNSKSPTEKMFFSRVSKKKISPWSVCTSHLSIKILFVLLFLALITFVWPLFSQISFFLWFFKSRLFQKLQQQNVNAIFWKQKKNTVNKMIKQECLC